MRNEKRLRLPSLTLLLGLALAMPTAARADDAALATPGRLDLDNMAGGLQCRPASSALL